MATNTTFFFLSPTFPYFSFHPFFLFPLFLPFFFVKKLSHISEKKERTIDNRKEKKNFLFANKTLTMHFSLID